jgi:hypothetical protein
METSCEHSNEPSGSIKSWEILVAERLAASQEGLSFMKLVCSSERTVTLREQLNLR